MATNRKFYAPCSPGFEELLAADARRAGARSIQTTKGGVKFLGDDAVAYHLCLWSRVAIRVTERIIHGPVESTDDLYDMAREVDWNRYLSPDHTMAVFSSVNSQFLTHSKFAALKVKDAVCDHFMEQRGVRPDIDTDRPDLPLKLVVRGQMATIFRDFAGDSLHKRGWRPVQVKSPLNEAVAAGLLQLAEWDKKAPLCDPMCGSATFLIEAAHLAGDRAPGLRRSFAFQRWPDYQRHVFEKLLADANERWEVGKIEIGTLLANDRHDGAIGIARRSARAAGVDEMITWSTSDIADYEPEVTPAMVVTNPPYGQRIGEGDDLANSWKQLGTFLKHKCKGAVAWTLSGDPGLTKAMHLRASLKIPVRNGPLDCRWLRYEMH